ncbi:MAG: ABC transporter ATP-binding protein [Anaerolineae bacterium]|nr:ABC transporter ATP-binding protein [Anaerolineae bacterium]
MQPLIEIENLSFAYPDGHAALHGVDLAIYPGDKVAIVGPNGAGKSTLFLHLNGILSASPAHGAGSVRVAGIEINNRTARQVRALVGLVFQDPDDQLFSPTVFEDVAFGPLHMGLPAADVRERVTYALSEVAMHGYEARMPHHLSLGERKRIAIATVLSMNPDILVLDEPSAGLDPRARRSLIGLLRSLPQTMLVATHDMRLVWELCPRTVVIDGGRIAADGPTAELLCDQTLMEQHGLETPLEALSAAAVC